MALTALGVDEEFVPFESRSAEAVLRWAVDRFGDRIAIASSFGVEDCVIIDMVTRFAQPKIFTLDTGRLPEETYDVMDAVRARYGADIEKYAPDPAEVTAMVSEHGFDLFYKSVELRRRCCYVRKVVPLERALANLDAWITGLRRDQEPSRGGIRKVEVDRLHGDRIKVNPLADWTWDRVWAYVRAHDVPYNRLHDRGYSSIGCAPCTRAVAPGQDVRAGRWWWERDAAKECGLHADPIASRVPPPRTGGD